MSEQEKKNMVDKNETLFHALFEETADAYLLIEEGAFIDCNQSAVEMLGANSKEEVLSLHPAEISPELQPDGQNSKEKADDILQSVLDTGESRRFEWTHQDVNRRNFLVEVLLNPISFNSRTIIHTVWRDITKRREAERTILENEERFRSVVENSQSGILILDNTYRFIYINSEFSKITGYIEEEIIGKDFRELLTDESKELVAEHYTRRQKGEEVPLRYEFSILRKDGERRDCEISSTVYKDSDGNIRSMGQFIDITERKRTTQKIKESQQLLEGFIDNAEAVAYVKDMEGHYILINNSYEDLFHIKRDEIIGKTDYDIFPQEAAQALQEADARIIEAKSPITIEEEVPQDDGFHTYLSNKFPVRDSSGKIYAIAGISTDITERKRIETEREHLLTIIETSTDFIGMISPDGKGLYINPAGLEMTGYTADEYYGGMSITDFEPTLPKEVMGIVEQKGAWSGETTFVTKNGQEFPVSQTITAQKDENGSLQGFATIVRNISEQKELEKRIQESFERRGEQVKLSTEISQEISQAKELSELFERVVTLTKENLGYYHTQLLRYNDIQDAVLLIKGYGETGAKMLADGHAMPLGAGLIGTAAEQGATILRSDLANDPDWKPNPLLPDTQGEIAVPIKLGNDVLGVLDIQSDTAGALTEDDQLLLEGLCGQIAIAMEQTRLQQEMNEQLEEMNRLYQTMSHEGWLQYRQTADFAKGFVYDQTTVHPIEKQEQESFANMPVKLPGGEVLGELGIIDDPENPLSEEDKAFIGQVSEQVALALESARLTEQTQIALSQTEILFQIGSQLNTASDEKEILSAVMEPTKDTGYFEASLFYMDDYKGDEPRSMTKVANWHHKNKPALPLGYQLDLQAFTVLDFLMSPDKVQLISDIPNSKNLEKAAKELWAKAGSVAIIVIPISQMGHWLGILTFSWNKPHEFSPSETAIYEAMISLVTPVVQSRRLFEQTQTALNNAQLSEARFRTIVENAPEAIVVFDMETGLFVEYNSNALLFYGLDEQEIFKVGPIDMSPPVQPDGSPSPETAMEQIQIALEGGAPVFEWVHRNATGENIDCEIRLVRMPDPTRTLVRASVVDIRERKKAEQTLRESQERAQTILESVTLPMLITRNSDNAITFANQLAADSIGLSIEEIMNSPELNLFANLEEREKFVAELTTEKIVNNMQILLKRHDQSTFWALFSARFFVYQGEASTLVTIADISDRIEAQEAITKRAAELATVAEVSTAAARALNIDELLQEVVDLTRKRFDLYHVHIYLLDNEKEHLQVQACGWEEGSPHSGTHGDTLIPLTTEKSIVIQATRNRIAVVVNDTNNDPNWLPNELMPNTRSEMAIPLIVGDELLGVFDIQSDELNRFSDEDVSIQTTLASQVAVALQNTRSYEEAKEQAEQESMINIINQRIQGTTTVEDALQVAVRELGRALGAKQASIQLDVGAKRQ